MKSEKLAKAITKGRQEISNTMVSTRSEIQEAVKNGTFNEKDEMYTPYGLLYNELLNYLRIDPNRLRGKDIICPCDFDISKEDPSLVGIKIVYNSDPDIVHDRQSGGDIEYWKVKSVITTKKSIYENPLYDSKSINYIEEPWEGMTSEELDIRLRETLKCSFIRDLRNLAKDYGFRSITATGYNPIDESGRDCMNQDYSNYDFCCTNPPFSLYSQKGKRKSFLELLIKESESRKNTDRPFDFLLLAPFLNRLAPSVGLPLYKKEIFLGFNRRIGIKFEQNPELIHKVETSSVACDWITTWDDAQRIVNDYNQYQTYTTYDDYKDQYPYMPNMWLKDTKLGDHPIRVDNVTLIPNDYEGWMMMSISVLDFLNTDKYYWINTAFLSYVNSNPDKNPFIHPFSGSMIKHPSGKGGFHGVLIKKKPGWVDPEKIDDNAYTECQVKWGENFNC